jgi:hypothetical protein
MESSIPPNDNLLTEDGDGPVLILALSHDPDGQLAMLHADGRVELVTGVVDGMMVAEELEFVEC